jgi:hypothetical protein
MIRRAIVLILIVGAACTSAKPAAAPTPVELAGDTVRATLMAAMVDEPPNPAWSAVRPLFPAGRRGRPGAAVLAFLIDTTGTPEIETLSLIDVRGDSAFAKNACAVIPKLRFAAPPGSRQRSMLILPFTYFAGPEMPAEFFELPEATRAKLENMSTVERRDFLLDKSCRRLR